MRSNSFLRKKTNLGLCRPTKAILSKLGLKTVCQEARCPNITECFSRNTATFMILGDVCTRNCLFCSVTKGTPAAPSCDESVRVAAAARELGLRYVVVTSPTRDDLPDGGAASFARAVHSLRAVPAVTGVELLIPDFDLNIPALEMVCQAQPDVIGHNIETVPSLYARVRPGADYSRSLRVVRLIKTISGHCFVKSGLMLGMGEARDEVIAVMEDLREAGCDFISLGQYLSPSRAHYPVQRYLTADEFSSYERIALYLGFKKVMSGFFVRSSWQAHRYIHPERGVQPADCGPPGAPGCSGSGCA